MVQDDYKLSGRRVRVNLLLRGCDLNPNPKGPPRLLAFGFVLDLSPEEIMAISEGKDVHFIGEVRIERAGSTTAEDTWNQSPEDILTAGIPAFASHGKAKE